MVGLRPATGQNGVRLLGDGICEHKFEFAYLVARKRAAGEVVSFDKYFDASFALRRASGCSGVGKRAKLIWGG
jgi:hypothetical protein